MGSTKRHILLTGPPGIGKTTLVQKVCKMLRDSNISVKGFVTEEVRNEGKRIGFDIVTLEGKCSSLARVAEPSRYMVGQYGVTLEQFETLALSVLSPQPDVGDILVLDEIGRMELFSEPFKQEVKKAFTNRNITILATIPVPKAKPMPFIEGLRQHPEATVLMVDRSNRDGLAGQVFKMLTKTC